MRKEGRRRQRRGGRWSRKKWRSRSKRGGKEVEGGGGGEEVEVG